MTRMRHGEGVVERRGQSSYRARWYGLDGKRRSKTFPTEAAAQAHLIDVSGRKRRRAYADPSSMTVAEAAEAWLDRGYRRWQGGTHAAHHIRVETHIVPAFGQRRVVDLDTRHIQAWVDTLTLAPNTISATLTTLSGILTECVQLGVVDRNRATGVKPPRRTPSVRVVWSAAEVRTVLHHLRNDPRWLAVYHLALSTGMRPGEMRALRWEDIDLERGVMLVRRTVIQTGEIRESTKSGRERAVSLEAPCLAALRAWQEKSVSPWVASTKPAPLNQNTWRRWHLGMCRQVKVKEVGLHGLRHTAATLLLGKGIHPKIVSDILGHASIAITLDTYSHANVDMQRAAMQSLTDVFGGVADDNMVNDEGSKTG